MRFLKLIVAYDGTYFFGWQWQPDRRTVQGELEGVIARITEKPLRIVASGRTDAGVHALGQVVGFETQCVLPLEVLLRALNAYAPSDLAVLAAEEVPESFHPINDAIAKRYRYVIHDDPVRDVFARHYTWHVRHRLDAIAMHEAAQSLAGTHDFKSYETSGSARVSTVRTIHEIQVCRQVHGGSQRVVLEVEANGFLYRMVRNIVGTLVEVGRGKRPVTWPGEVLCACDRRLAGVSAVPQGLYLLHVRFAQ